MLVGVNVGSLAVYILLKVMHIDFYESSTFAANGLTILPVIHYLFTVCGQCRFHQIRFISFPVAFVLTIVFTKLQTTARNVKSVRMGRNYVCVAGQNTNES